MVMLGQCQKSKKRLPSLYRGQILLLSDSLLHNFAIYHSVDRNLLTLPFAIRGNASIPVLELGEGLRG